MRDTPSDTGLAIRERAIRLGFDSVGITALRASDHAGFLREWLGRGRHGDMDWLARPDAVEARADPRSRWPALRSAIVVTMNYGGTVAGSRERTDQALTAESIEGDDTSDASRAIIARYARGRDYHRVMKKKLLLLLREVESIAGQELPAARAYVDTGPVLERELAQRAGLGWFGRNTMLIHPRRGSYSFLAALLTELDIEGDTEPVRDHCGTCNACVEACPTGALLGRDDDGAPVIDATRCISYLTIEHRGAIPRELRPLIGNRVFGCDICQEVCPFPRKFSSPSTEPSFAARGPGEPPFGVEKLPSDGWHPGTRSPSLVDLMTLDEAGWEAFSRGSALRRAGRAGFLRNVAVALGNWGSDQAVPVLASALSDSDPLVRGHAAWALGEVASPEAFDALESCGSSEDDPFVRSELEAALDRSRPKEK
jgi:epoxyqueuosine reductase